MGVYLVGRKGAGPDEMPQIIEARTEASAIAHAGRATFAATIITTKEAMAWAAKGVELQVVGQAEVIDQAVIAESDKANEKPHK